MARKGAVDRGLFERPAGIWWIQYADSTGKRRREKVGMKRAALALYARRKRETREGVLRPERKRKVTFAEITADAIARSKARNSSWKDDVSRSRPILKAFANRPADEITARDIERWLEDYMTKNKVTAATMNKYRALFSSIFTTAFKAERIKTNPVRLTSPMPVQNSRVRFLTTEEQDELLAAQDSDQHRKEILFAAHTGVRKSNQFNLRWDQIDWAQCTAFFAHTKNGESRHVHLNTDVIELLQSLPRDSEYVFTESQNELERNNRLNWWYTALEKTSIKNFRWHDLRHTFASRLAMKGHSMRTLQMALGHRSPQMTMRYAHLDDDHMKAAMQDLVAVPVPVESR